MRKGKNMKNFFGNLSTNKSEHLLKATPYTKNTMDNFTNLLNKETFFLNCTQEEMRILIINQIMTYLIQK